MDDNEGKISIRSIRRSTFQIARLLVRVDVPDDVVGETDDLVSGAFGHFGEPFRLGLVFEGVAWEIDALYHMSVNERKTDCKKKVVSLPDRWTSAFTRMLTPPIPSSSTSSSLLFRQSPSLTRYVLPVSYSSYPVPGDQSIIFERRTANTIPSAKIVSLSRLAASRNPLSDSIQEL